MYESFEHFVDRNRSTGDWPLWHPRQPSSVGTGRILAGAGSLVVAMPSTAVPCVTPSRRLEATYWAPTSVDVPRKRSVRTADRDVRGLRRNPNPRVMRCRRWSRGAPLIFSSSSKALIVSCKARTTRYITTYDLHLANHHTQADTPLAYSAAVPHPRNLHSRSGRRRPGRTDYVSAPGWCVRSM
jgi:hypothetical protein